MDSTEVIHSVFMVGYSAGMGMGEAIFLMVTVCSVFLFIGKLMR